MRDNTMSSDCDSLDRARAEVHGMRVPDPPPAELFLARLPASYAASAAVGLAGPDSALRSNRVRRGVRFTTAAVVLSIVAGWLVVSWPRSHVLAQAIAATEKSDIVRCKITTSAHVDYLAGGKAESTETIYFDLKAPRLRTESPRLTVMNAWSTEWVTVWDNRADRILKTWESELIIDEAKADAKLRPLIEEAKRKGTFGKHASLGRITGEGVYPFIRAKTDKPFLDLLREFQNRKNVTSVEETLDGRHTMKFQLKEADRTSTLWIDVETKRPVRIEEERPNKGEKITDYKWTLSDFEWDVKGLTGQLFSVEPPAGYTLDDRTSEIQSSKQNR